MVLSQFLITSEWPTIHPEPARSNCKEATSKHGHLYGSGFGNNGLSVPEAVLPMVRRGRSRARGLAVTALARLGVRERTDLKLGGEIAS
jgi:hypothetical protein